MVTYEVRERDVYPSGDNTVELDSDATILTSEYRGSNRIVIAYLVPVNDEDETYRCEACDKTFDSEHGMKIHQGSQH